MIRDIIETLLVDTGYVLNRAGNAALDLVDLFFAAATNKHLWYLLSISTLLALLLNF